MKQLIVEMTDHDKKLFKQLTTDNDTSMAVVVRSCISKWMAEKKKSLIY